MPELPEVAAIAQALTDELAGYGVTSAELGSLSALKTYDPPFATLAGSTMLQAGRMGKFLHLDLVDADGEQLLLVVHLSRAGWLHWRKASVGQLRPGKGPTALRLRWSTEPELVLDITEAGTQKRLAVYLVRDLAQVPGIPRLGPDVLTLDAAGWAQILADQGKRGLKSVLRDQQVVAGIGNAYSDEILHAARLSPYAAAAGLTPEQVTTLADSVADVLTTATRRVAESGIGRIKAEKRSGLKVHGRTGEKCPVCGDVVAQVRLADSDFQYCPTCQTGGKKLADRRMSRLLK